VGKAYVERFFPPESKRAVEEIVANEVAGFRQRIDGLAWMAPSTKAMAKAKLATLRVGVGYPDRWRDYDDLKVVRGDALGNQERAELFEYRRSVAKLGHPADRGDWEELPQVANALNLPVRNALNFPAAILAPPFFDPQATSAANYGGIGGIIGHEISHSFDDEGAKFDARGRFVNWWTPDDLARFQACGMALVAQFSCVQAVPRPGREWKADTEREPRRPRWARRRVRRVAYVARREGGADHRRHDRRSAVLPQLRAGVAEEDA
jgi:putative endopeptidase